jgi:hypothetical protein
MKHALLPLIGALAVAMFVPSADAQGFIRDIVNSAALGTGGGGGGGSGGAAFNAILFYLVGAFRILVLVAAGIAITVVGLRMVIGQEDDAIEKGKTVVVASISGVVLAFLIEPFVDAFVNLQAGGLNAGASEIINREASGLVDWGLAVAGVLGVLFIIITALKAVANPTSEEGITNLRQTVFSVIIGLILLGVRAVLAVAVGGTFAPDPTGIIEIPVRIISAILALLALLAVGIIIYAGILMIFNFTNEEQIQKGKSLIFRAITGLALIIMSYALIRFVIGVVVV